MPAPDSPAARWRALQRRWWVEYNPLALLSATLVLGGLTALSTDAHLDGVAALAISVVAELYAFCLIGGAGLLMRMSKRRPAAILGLLAVLFQADLTMHVETSAYLGAVGALAAPAWFLVFALKLCGLRWAFRLRFSRSVLGVALFGAAGLAALPSVLATIGSGGGPLVGAWLFALFAAGLWSDRSVSSEVPLDDRARRAMRFTWGLWGAAALAHAMHWTVSLSLDLSAWPALALLLLARGVRRERTHWLLAGSVLAGTMLFTPASAALVSGAVALVLALVAWATPPMLLVRLAAPPPGPYREPRVTDGYGVEVDRAARARLLMGAATALYAALWLRGAGPLEAGLPEHSIGGLVVLTLVLGWWAERRGRATWLAPLMPLYLHLLAQVGWVRMPHGATEWGLTSTVLGFAVLVGSLLLQSLRPPRARDDRERAVGGTGVEPATSSV